MRTLRLLIPALVLIASCSGDTEPANNTSKTNATNPDAVEVTEGTPVEAAKQIAGFVIANDNAGLMNLIITQEEMTEVITGSTVTPMGKEVAIKNIPTEISKMRVDYTNGLAEVRKQCEASGVEWSNCKFKDVKYEMNNPTGYFMAQLVCVLECNGMEYKFTVSDVVQTKNGWRLGGTMYYGDVPQVKPQPVK
jgi:PBP1b-binding outer membrane lipoprotein LpoB